MDIVLYGLNHMTAPLAIRERLSYKPEEASEFMSDLRSLGVFMENLLVSTCNRTEFYGIAEIAEESYSKLQNILESAHDIQPGTIGAYIYRRRNIQAVEHLFSVASGIDSMVIGEVEILGQLKSAYRTATGVDTTGPFLNKLFHKAFKVGKLVRNETLISAGTISVATISVELALKVLGRLDNKKVLVIGAGDTARNIARSLSMAGVTDFSITNRTMEKAVELVEFIGGKVIPFESYPSELTGFDLIITALGVPGTIGKDMLKRVRGMYPLMIDLGVPRDIHESVENLSGAIVYHIDDLQGIVKEKITRREKEIPKAKQLIRAETAEFIGWCESIKAASTIEDIKNKIQDQRRQVLDKWLGKINDREYKLVEKITGELINKVIHDPINGLKGCELEAGEKHCSNCDMFGKDEGPCHGNYNSELKTAIARMLFGLENDRKR